MPPSGIYFQQTADLANCTNPVLIPAAFLASCRIEDQVDMQLQDGHILITPVKRKLREAWFDSYAAAADSTLALERGEMQVWDDAITTDDSEWAW
jgi:antitoxin component of MazEF toxin-antitoxin module